MSSVRLLDVIRRPLPVFDAQAGARAVDAAARGSDAFAELAAAEPGVTEFLASVFAASPYLARTAAADPELVNSALRGDPRAATTNAVAAVRSLAQAESEAELMHGLRSAKRRLHFIVAMADLAQFWSLVEVTAALSEFADACVEAALHAQCVRDAAAGRLEAAAAPAEGLFVLALGKLGAGELNYSSDIDLVVGFDSDVLRRRGADDPQAYASRVAKALVRQLNERTEHGYVFRVDLRLRPDPGATPPAVSTEAALRYYEALGRSWERAAFIKARCCAGDHATAAHFLSRLRPFVWRRSLDFAAVNDIHKLKRRVQNRASAPGADLGGWNIKTGRGGIREIEFFAQTQQLLFGGRDERLRARDTCGALAALQAAGIVETETRELLEQSYIAHRAVEHRLQMIEDQQTHEIPVSASDRRRVAALCGIAEPSAFERVVRARARTVSEIYDLLFAGSEDDADTALPDDAEALEAVLAKMGFAQARGVAATLDSWRAGRVRATRVQRARQDLERLAPFILEAAAEQADPDQAFARFADFFESLNAGVQVMAMFAAEPQMLKDVVTLLTCAPRVGGELARQPAAFDIMFDPSFGEAVVNGAALAAERAKAEVERAESFETAINIIRRIGRDERFRIGAHLLTGRASAVEAQTAYTKLADGLVAAAAKASAAEATKRHGRLDGRFVVLGLGKLGGRELAADSDLDLMIVYDSPAGAASDGDKPLTADAYFGRLTQRLIAALSAPTEEGALYDVDMQLRPSGSAGPIAVSVKAFEHYYESDAWTWELMALTRARAIAGDPGLASDVERLLHATLARARDLGGVLTDVASMRRRVRSEKPDRGAWDLKLAPGGLMDIEFVAQGMQVALAGESPSVLSVSTADALRRLAEAGRLSPTDLETFSQALQLQLNARQILALSVDGVFEPDDASPALLSLLANACGAPRFETLDLELRAAQERAAAAYEAAVGETTAAATDSEGGSVEEA